MRLEVDRAERTPVILSRCGGAGVVRCVVVTCREDSGFGGGREGKQNASCR